MVLEKTRKVHNSNNICLLNDKHSVDKYYYCYELGGRWVVLVRSKLRPLETPKGGQQLFSLFLLFYSCKFISLLLTLRF